MYKKHFITIVEKSESKTLVRGISKAWNDQVQAYESVAPTGSRGKRYPNLKLTTSIPNVCSFSKGQSGQLRQKGDSLEKIERTRRAVEAKRKATATRDTSEMIDSRLSLVYYRCIARLELKREVLVTQHSPIGIKKLKHKRSPSRR